MALPQETHSMLTVKEAAQILGVDPRTIREKLLNQQLRGEKRLHGLKEKWYVNKADIDALAREQHERGAQLQEQRLDTSDIQPLFEHSQGTETIDLDDIDDADEVEEPKMASSTVNDQLEILIGALTKQFSAELSQQKEVLFELKKELAEKDLQLRLLPDLEKAAREKEEESLRKQALLENKEFENQALKRQLKLIELEKEKKELEYSSSKEELKALAEQEKKLKAEMEALAEEKALQEKSARTFEEEIETVRKELELRNQELEKFQKPWWKKFFLPREAEAE